MSTVAILREQHLEVDPGYQVSCQLSVYNSGGIVEQFTVDVVGDTSEWAVVEPATLSLFPNTQQDVTVTFSPPRLWHVSPGPMPFGIRISPANDPEGSIVEEGVLLVGDFTEVNAELIPQVITGRRKGKLGIAIDSNGNMPMPVILRGRDPADALAITVKPRQIVLEPGQAAFARLRVVPRKTYLRGPQRQARFKVFVEPQISDVEPVVLDATLVQRSLLPRGSVGVLGILAAIAVWFLLIRPVVKNTAVNAVKPATQAAAANAATASSAAAVAANAAAAKTAATLAAQQAAIAALSDTTTTGPSTTVPSTTTTTLPPPPAKTVTNPNNYAAIEVVAQPGQLKTGSYQVPVGDTLSIADLVIQSFSTGQGQVRIQVLPSGATAGQTLLLYNLATLTEDTQPLVPSIVFNQGDTLVVTVSCGTQRSACDVNVLYGGAQTSPAPTTTTVPGATTTTAAAG